MEKEQFEAIEKLGHMIVLDRLSNANNNFYEEIGETPFENDYTRMIMSSPVRRLQDKAQVFPLDRTDFTRTRLTHSLEVSDIAKQLGVYVEKLLLKQIEEVKNVEFLDKHYIPQILQVAGLIHDIGNPPCGHYGEQTIKDYFAKLQKAQERVKKITIQQNQTAAQIQSQSHNETDENTDLALLIAKQATLSVERTYTYTNRIAEAFNKMTETQKEDLINFDGNVQDLRLLTHLGLANDEHSFNLTATVLATIIKYPYSSISGNKKGKEYSHIQSKFGYFDSEKREYKTIIEKVGLKKNQRHPLTFLLEAADDITYLTCDVEDGYRQGIISFDEIISALPNNFKEQHSDIINFENRENHSTERNKYDFTPTQCEEYIQEIRILAQQDMIRACAQLFVDKMKEIVDGIYTDELLKKSTASQLRKTFENLSVKNFENYGVIKSELLGGKAIATLMDMFIQALFDETITYMKDNECKINTKTQAYKLYSLISSNYRNVACSGISEIDFLYDKDNKYAYQKFQLVTDYIAGMTDKYALQLYHDLVG